MSESSGGSFSGEHQFDPRYLAFFEEFNRQQYFEAHEVLEGLWLETRSDRREFYKGLIQVAAVFLKLKQEKIEPAQRLAARALSHLEPYRPRCDGLDVNAIADLLRAVAAGQEVTVGHQLTIAPRSSA